MKGSILFSYLLVALCGTAAAAQFQNLGFDDANTNNFQIGPGMIRFTDAATAVPGWHLGEPVPGYPYPVYDSGYGANVLVDDFVTASSAQIAILYDPRQTVFPVDGKFSLLLVPGGYPNAVGLQMLAVSQSGQVPADAKSLHFLSFGGPAQFDINGSLTPVLYVPQGGAAPTFEDAYADVSKYAGQTVTLQFSAVFNLAGVDGISFSSEAVAEPSTFGLLVFGLTLGVVVGKVRPENRFRAS
ncbi:MAG: hypothetical protein ACYDH9_18125 [Limisphaerales bacterium]